MRGQRTEEQGRTEPFSSENGRSGDRPGEDSVPRHLFEMEAILKKAILKMDELEQMIAEFEDFQPEIKKLEAYYTGQQWKDDYAMDEAGCFPEELRRGVLSQDGIWNMLERNQELIRRIGIAEEESHDGME